MQTSRWLKGKNFCSCAGQCWPKQSSRRARYSKPFSKGELAGDSIPPFLAVPTSGRIAGTALLTPLVRRGKRLCGRVSSHTNCPLQLVLCKVVGISCRRIKTEVGPGALQDRSRLIEQLQKILQAAKIVLGFDPGV